MDVRKAVVTELPEYAAVADGVSYAAITDIDLNMAHIGGDMAVISLSYTVAGKDAGRASAANPGRLGLLFKEEAWGGPIDGARTDKLFAIEWTCGGRDEVSVTTTVTMARGVYDRIGAASLVVKDYEPEPC